METEQKKKITREISQIFYMADDDLVAAAVSATSMNAGLPLRPTQDIDSSSPPPPDPKKPPPPKVKPPQSQAQVPAPVPPLEGEDRPATSLSLIHI